MGHMLNNTIQDVLIRKARLDGKNACWVPGTDHASIATEAKVVRKLREEGIKKSDLSREAFLDHAWDWTDNYGGIILKQLRKLGASADWDRTAFTMDDKRYKAVIKAFIDLHKAGKLYRGLRMVNWDPEAKTVLSNEEVLYKEENSKLYHIKYRIKDSDDSVIIATTRPETLLGDTAVAVHPEDDRYSNLKDRHAIVPLVNREVPFIFDDYVDREFGTGALKVTPAHDPNDYDLGLKHNLEVIDIFNDDASLNENATLFVGMDRFEVRKAIVKKLDEAGLLEKVEDIRNNVGRSERTNSVVEPKLSLQWYVDMKQLAKPALEAVESGEIKFHPEKYINTYRHWMTNIKDWCISRQLWWGHRIPAYYYEEGIYVAESKEEAYAQALIDYPELKIEHLRQDEDVLDTWFSSWLWPISVFDGFEDRSELDYYYPTSVLVTGWDIIFLWVARMIMAGYEWEGKFPFKHVYFTGMVRDKQRRKMSKSLGNSPDALELIDKYGADGVRYGMLSCSPAGGDLLFDDKLVENGRNFCNKIWNASQFLLNLESDNNKTTPPENKLVDIWLNAKFNEVVQQVEHNYQQFRISDCLMGLYSFIWNDIFSWYLEIIKPAYVDGHQESIDTATKQKAIAFFERFSILLHPFMPFITEEVYQNLQKREEGDFIGLQSYPRSEEEVNKSVLSDFELIKDIISNIRDLKNKNQIKSYETLDLKYVSNDEINAALSREGAKELIQKMAFVEGIDSVGSDDSVDGFVFISGKTKFYAVFDIELDVEEELVKLKEELEYQKGFVSSVQKKLSNQGFVNNAPAAVVDKERKKLADGEARVLALEDRIKQLS
jgi:valyl-tRNA synthetase